MPTVFWIVLAIAVVALSIHTVLLIRRSRRLMAAATAKPPAPPKRVRAFDFPTPTQPDPPEVRHERYERACASPTGLAA